MEDDQKQSSPDQVILDLIFDYGLDVRVLSSSPTRILLCGKNHLGERFQQILEINLDGEPDNGPPPRFVLLQLGSTVWKITPSLFVPSLVHGYITIINVPEPAPWSKP